MTDVIRWGVLGASNFALRKMVPAIHLAAGHEVVALGTGSPEKVAPFAALVPGLRVHGDYDAVLADTEVDAVYIPLPHTLHVEWAEKALRAGKHVLVEKPVAMNAGDIAPLIAARDETGLICAEAYMIVHHPQWQRVRALLAEGAIGTLRHVESVFTYDNSADPGNIRNGAATGGGALPDIGVYSFGSVRWATGLEPEAITHVDIDWEAGCDVLTRVSARFPGFSAHFVNSMRLLPDQFIVFHGDKGLIRMTCPFNAGSFDVARVEVHGRNTVAVERWTEPNQYVLQVVAFGAAIRGEAAFPWTLEDARGTQAMIDAVYAQAGGRPGL